MKYLILLMSFLPIMVYGQTVHLKKGKIVYKGTVKNLNYSQSDLYERAKKALANNVKPNGSTFYLHNMETGEMALKGEMTLNAPSGIVKTLLYNLKIKIKDSSYKYRIDEVYVKQEEKGMKNIVTPSAALVKGMNISGSVAINTEKQLNEIDMGFQKLIALIKRDIRK